MQIVYTTIKKEDLKKIVKKETGLSLYKFAELCPGKSINYLYSLDRETLRISGEKWEELKGQIEAVKLLNKPKSQSRPEGK